MGDQTAGYLDAVEGSLDWALLLEKRRVVILAEGGSGKTTELEEQNRLTGPGTDSFYLTLQNIGAKGVERAMGPSTWSRFRAWLSSDRPARFFLDSVDEAKAADIVFSDILKEVAEHIAPAASRAHIILAGRHGDWEFRRDLQALEELLPIPPADSVVTEIDPDEALKTALDHREPVKPPSPEKPLVVLLAPLDEERVGRFLVAKGVINVEAFVAELGAKNLWSFARRPLDLDWLVAHWREHQRFGPLIEMIELSIRARLKEENPNRRRKDLLDQDLAYGAMRRVGAALALVREDGVATADSSMALTPRPTDLDLREVLPDWSDNKLTLLANRPIFDPWAPGVSRLHNDNLKVVRGYLAARWIQALQNADCPWSRVRDLLFATTHGVDLVKPSMRVTAAWMAQWDTAVAKELVRRDPYLLMTVGDPASLPLQTRKDVLLAVIAAIRNDDDLSNIDKDGLRRFAQPDLAPFVVEQWKLNDKAPAVRELLLLLIWLGQLQACFDVANAAAFETFADRYSKIFAGRAVMAIGDAGQKRHYVDRLLTYTGPQTSLLAWDAIEALFPASLSIKDLLALLKRIDLKNRGGGLGLAYQAPKLVGRLGNHAELTELTDGLLKLAGPRLSADAEEQDDSPILVAISAAAERMLSFETPDAASDLAIQAAIRTGDRAHNGVRNEGAGFLKQLQSHSARRRQALWGAVAWLRGRKSAAGKGSLPDWAWSAEVWAFPIGLQAEDMSWLLADARDLPVDEDAGTALHAALRIWVQTGKASDVLSEIIDAVSTRSNLKPVIDEWTIPRVKTQEEIDYDAKRDRIKQEQAVAQAQRLESWKAFGKKMKADPGQLERFVRPTAERIDGNLHSIWLLLDGKGENHGRHAIADLSPLSPLFGQPVVDAFRRALIAHWRCWRPKLPGELPADQRSMYFHCDSMGLVGITQEALADALWATRLEAEEARLAVRYATKALNGFPAWLDDLARAHPKIVSEILWKSVAVELDDSVGEGRRHALENLSTASEAVLEALADHAYKLVFDKPDLAGPILRPLLRILRRGTKHHGKILWLAKARFGETARALDRGAYLGVIYALDAGQATSILLAALPALEEAAKIALVQTALPQIFGNGWSVGDMSPADIPFASREDIIRLAFATIKPSEDIDRSDGEVYSPGERDHAEYARNAIFNSFVSEPGLATYQAIKRLTAISDFPISRQRLEELALQRAAEDSESGVWRAGDVKAFEADFMTTPATSADLQRVALGRIEDIQHELIDGDFNQGKTVAKLTSELEVQNWMADRLRTLEGRSYTFEREPHVADEKEPDIRFQSRVTDARAPLEIKVVESWSLKELETALTAQLRGRYLRDRNNRYGILLLVHRRPRKRGWLCKGVTLSFDQVTAHLRSIAATAAAVDLLAPQMAVAVIDVSKVPIDAPAPNTSAPAKVVAGRKGNGYCTKKGAAAAKKAGV